MSSFKYLGVFIDEKLNWGTHIQMISGKLSRTCGIIYRVRNLLNQSSKKLLYYALVYPYLQYCNVVWGMAGNTLLGKLQVLQNRFIRIINFLDYRTSLTVYYKDMFILKLESVHSLELGKFIFNQLYLISKIC